MDTFQDTHYQIDIEQEPGCLRKAQTTLSAEEVRRLRKRAVKTVSKQISIPGFRKGKVPESVIEERYAAQIDREWKELVIDHAIQHGFKLARTIPVNRRLIGNPNLVSCELDQGAKVSFAYEVYPRIRAIDLSILTLPVIPERSATAEEVEQKLAELRQWRCTYEPLDKAVESGDRVTIDLHNLATGSQVLSDYRVKVEDPMSPWLVSLLLGMRAGEMKEGHTEGEDRFPCTVKVCQVLHQVLPEVDQAFAETVGAPSVEELHQRLQHQTQSSIDTERHEQLVNAFHDALVEAYPIELPRSWIEEETQMRLSKEEHPTPEQETTIKDAAIYALRLHLLRQLLAEQLRIEVSKEEVQRQQLTYQFRRRFTDTSEEDSDDQFEKVRLDLALRKASDRAVHEILALQAASSMILLPESQP